MSHLSHRVLALEGLDFEGHCLDVGAHEHELLDVATGSDEVLKCQQDVFTSKRKKLK